MIQRNYTALFGFAMIQISINHNLKRKIIFLWGRSIDITWKYPTPLCLSLSWTIFRAHAVHSTEMRTPPKENHEVYNLDMSSLYSLGSPIRWTWEDWGNPPGWGKETKQWAFPFLGSNLKVQDSLCLQDVCHDTRSKHDHSCKRLFSSFGQNLIEGGTLS